MRLNTLSLRGLTRFAETVSIDFAAIGPGLVALVGANGEGKTTIMESIPAALFRSLPSRDGALPNHCQGRDAFVDLTFAQGGAAYRALVKIDAEQGGQEAVLFNSDGSQPLTSGKVREYDEAVRARVADPAIFLASVFAAQNRAGNFLDASKAERKDLFVRMLGLDHLQRTADQAKEKARASEIAVSVLLTKINDLSASVAKRPELEAQLAAKEAELAAADADLRIATDALEAAKAHLASLTAAGESLSSLMAQQATIGDEIKALGVDLTTVNRDRLDYMERLANAQSFLAKRDDIEAAEAKATEAKAIVDKLAEQIAAMEAEERAETDKLRRKAEHDRAVSEANAALVRAEGDLSIANGNLERASRGAALLEQVPCGDGFPSCQFLTNAVADRDAILGLGSTVAQATVNVDQAKQRLTLAKSNAAGLDYDPALGESLSRSLIAAREDLRTNGVRIEAFRKTADLRPRLEEADAAVVERRRQIADCEQRSATIGETIVARQTAIQDLQKQADAARNASAERAQADIAVISAQATVTQQQKRRDEIQQAIGGLSGQIAQTGKDADGLATMQAQQGEMIAEQSDWEALAKALGRDGVQALEIDAAGPEVSSLTNELLESCFGTRFTVSFETTRAKKDGGTAETFDVRVIDNDRGREGGIGSLSGGEKVILNEAISLALAIFNSRKSGRPLETLFRDETAGALDPDNAARYVQMLRRARDLGGFHQVIFIAHQVEVWESADAVIRVAGGKAVVA